jgi:hypothetical protein
MKIHAIVPCGERGSDRERITRRSELGLSKAVSSLVNFLFGDFSLVWIASGLPTIHPRSRFARRAPYV